MITTMKALQSCQRLWPMRRMLHHWCATMWAAAFVVNSSILKAACKKWWIKCCRAPWSTEGSRRSSRDSTRKKETTDKETSLCNRSLLCRCLARAATQTKAGKLVGVQTNNGQISCLSSTLTTKIEKATRKRIHACGLTKDAPLKERHVSRP